MSLLSDVCQRSSAAAKCTDHGVWQICLQSLPHLPSSSLLLLPLLLLLLLTMRLLSKLENPVGDKVLLDTVSM